MPPPLIDRIQQNLQPTTTTTWADTPAPFVTTVVSVGDIAFQTVTAPTAETTWASTPDGGQPASAAEPAIPTPTGRELTWASEIAPSPGLPSVPVEPPTPALVEAGPLAPSGALVLSQFEAPSPVDVPGQPADTLTAEGVALGGPSSGPPLLDIAALVEVGPPALGGEAEATQPTPAVVVQYVLAVADTLAFVTWGALESPLGPEPTLVSVPFPLYPAFVQDVAAPAGPAPGPDVSIPLLEVGSLAPPEAFAEVPSPFLGALAAAAIAFAPLAWPTGPLPYPQQPPVEEPAQPLPPQLPYDWLWSLDIRWEAEPGPDRLLIEEPLAPLPTWAELTAPGNGRLPIPTEAPSGSIKKPPHVVKIDRGAQGSTGGTWTARLVCGPRYGKQVIDAPCEPPPPSYPPPPDDDLPLPSPPPPRRPPAGGEPYILDRFGRGVAKWISSPRNLIWALKLVVQLSRDDGDPKE